MPQTIIVGMHQAKTQLSRLVAQAEAGDEVIIARNGKPAVTLALAPSAGGRDPGWRPRLGTLAGRVWLSPAFDAPLAEMEAALAQPLDPDHR